MGGGNYALHYLALEFTRVSSTSPMTVWSGETIVLGRHGTISYLLEYIPNLLPPSRENRTRIFHHHQPQPKLTALSPSVHQEQPQTRSSFALELVSSLVYSPAPPVFQPGPKKTRTVNRFFLSLPPLPTHPSLFFSFLTLRRNGESWHA